MGVLHIKKGQSIDKSAMRASGLIPVIPLIVINKDTQLPY